MAAGGVNFLVEVNTPHFARYALLIVLIMFFRTSSKSSWARFYWKLRSRSSTLRIALLPGNHPSRYWPICARNALVTQETCIALKSPKRRRVSGWPDLSWRWCLLSNFCIPWPSHNSFRRNKRRKEGNCSWIPDSFCYWLHQCKRCPGNNWGRFGF